MEELLVRIKTICGYREILELKDKYERLPWKALAEEIEVCSYSVADWKKTIGYLTGISPSFINSYEAVREWICFQGSSQAVTQNLDAETSDRILKNVLRRAGLKVVSLNSAKRHAEKEKIYG